MGKETFESVFMGLPNGCVLKTPNTWCSQYQASYKGNSSRGFTVKADTPQEALIKLAQRLAETNSQQQPVKNALGNQRRV